MILMRHGQSEFNKHFSATRRDPGIADPALTPLGQEQAEAAAVALGAEGIARIMVSPYTRTLQTAVPIARALGVPVVINPIVRERCAFTCDIGTPRTELALRWPQHDFAAIDEIWWPASTESAAQMLDRAALFRAEMAALSGSPPAWAATLVITHWGFIMALTGISVANGQWLRYDPTAPAPAEVSWQP